MDQGSEQRHFNSQAEGQDSLRQAITYNNKSKEKQVKETVPAKSQNRLFPATPVSPAACGRLNPPIQLATTQSKHSEFVVPVKLYASQEMEMHALK